MARSRLRVWPCSSARSCVSPTRPTGGITPPPPLEVPKSRAPSPGVIPHWPGGCRGGGGRSKMEDYKRSEAQPPLPPLPTEGREEVPKAAERPIRLEPSEIQRKPWVSTREVVGPGARAEAGRDGPVE